MLRKRIQLGLIHVAVAMTLVPINSTLNRVMIHELAISATLVAVLASLPYLFSPIQILIGSFSDHHPVWGWRRTPYVLMGLVLCVFGVVLSPLAAYLLAQNFLAGLLLGLFAFGAWGMGFNFSTVSYLSLASELSGEQGRGKTIATMWFMMIVSIILTAILISRLVDPFTAQALLRSFWVVGLAALVLGMLGVIKLEPRIATEKAETEVRYSWRETSKSVLENPQATLFFVYLIVLLIALLGQDILLEPFGGQAFQMPVQVTTRITAIWGTFSLIALLVAGAIERRFSKRVVAVWGGWLALVGFVLIASSGVIVNERIFYAGVVLLGLGTGLSTVANLSLMLDMTTAGKVGLFIGAWGMANAISRLAGSVLGGAVRDTLTQLLSNPVHAYVIVFGLMAILLFVSLLMLRRIDVSAFQEGAQGAGLVERAALASEAS